MTHTQFWTTVTIVLFVIAGLELMTYERLHVAITITIVIILFGNVESFQRTRNKQKGSNNRERDPSK